MGLFSCCTTNVVDSIVTEDLSEEKVQNRKVTSASSKESKDSGCPSDKTLSIADEHRGDGDQAGINEDSEDDFTNGGIITENSPLETVQAIESENRPQTPEFCLTGVAMTQDSVKKIQTKAVLDELSAENSIAETVQSPSGAVAYTFGEPVNFSKRAPSRLPPLAPRKNIDKKTIDDNLQKAENNKQKQLSLIREKSFMREERRREVLERKKANSNENDNKVDNEQPERILHTENDQITSN